MMSMRLVCLKTTVTRYLFEGMTSGVSVAGVGRAEPGPLWSALAAADLGWYVFPCAPGAKRPALRENWQDLATTDADRIRSWWAHQPYNIGIACGQSGLVVIDLDVAHEGRAGLDGPVSGADALERLCRAHGQRYPGGTYTVDTPSGGTHLYFTAPKTPVRNSAGRLGPLIDVRADGGYVVGDGSRIGGRAYTARGGVLPLALPLPDWIARLLTEEPALPGKGGGWGWPARAGGGGRRRGPSRFSTARRAGPTPWPRSARRPAGSPRRGSGPGTTRSTGPRSASASWSRPA